MRRWTSMPLGCACLRWPRLSTPTLNARTLLRSTVKSPAWVDFSVSGGFCVSSPGCSVCCFARCRSDLKRNLAVFLAAVCSLTAPLVQCRAAYLWEEVSRKEAFKRRATCARIIICCSFQLTAWNGLLLFSLSLSTPLCLSFEVACYVSLMWRK